MLNRAIGRERVESIGWQRVIPTAMRPLPRRRIGPACGTSS